MFILTIRCNRSARARQNRKPVAYRQEKTPYYPHRRFVLRFVYLRKKALVEKQKLEQAFGAKMKAITAKDSICAIKSRQVRKRPISPTAKNIPRPFDY